MFRQIVLGLLRTGEPQHGYGLMKEYQERAGVRVSSGGFYRELMRLQQDGLIETTKRPEGTDERRELYEITAAGGAAFDQWLTQLRDTHVANDDLDEITGHTVLLTETDPAVARGLFETWRDALWHMIKNLERDRDRALVRTPQLQSTRFPSAYVLLSRRIKRLTNEVEFVDALEQAHTEWFRSFGEKLHRRAARTSAGIPTQPVTAPAKEPATRLVFKRDRLRISQKGA